MSYLTGLLAELVHCSDGSHRKGDVESRGDVLLYFQTDKILHVRIGLLSTLKGNEHTRIMFVLVDPLSLYAKINCTP